MIVAYLSSSSFGLSSSVEHIIRPRQTLWGSGGTVVVVAQAGWSGADGLGILWESIEHFFYQR
jgi:hypothetical protein